MSYPSSTALGTLGGCLLLAILIGRGKYATVLMLIPLTFYFIYSDNGLWYGFALMVAVGIPARLLDQLIYEIPKNFSDTEPPDNHDN